MRGGFLNDMTFEPRVGELQGFSGLYPRGCRMITEGQPPGKFEVLSVRYEWVSFAGAPESGHGQERWGGEGSRGQIPGLEWWVAPCTRQKGQLHFLMLYSKLLFFSDFGLLFVWEHFFISFLFFLCLRLNYTSPGAVSDCCCNSLSTNWDFCIKQLCGAHQTSRKLELLL